MLVTQTLHVSDSLKGLGFKVQKLEIFEIGGTVYLLVDGRMNVFVFENGTWNDISRSVYHGYNYFSKKFVHASTLYSFGGYGFWKQHGDLIRFDRERKEWEAIPVQYKHDIGNGLSYQADSLLVVLLPSTKNQAYALQENYTSIYELNLETGDVVQLSTNITALPNDRRLAIESDNFYLVHGATSFLIDKKTKSFKHGDLSYFHLLNTIQDSSIVIVRSDSLVFWNGPGKVQQKIFDLSASFSDLDGASKELFKSRNYFVLAIPFLLVMGLASYYFLRKRNNPGKSTTHPFIAPLLVHNGELLDTETLDRIFGIERIIPSETQRHKRSSIINSINLEYRSIYGADLIKRIQDKEDKRRFLYKIN
jgi:hypothetical protein